MTPLRLALATIPATLTGPSTNVEQMCQYCLEAKAGKAQLVVFPELSLTGYANGVSTSQRALTENEALSLLSSAARETDIGVLAGFPEKDENGALYASHIALLPDGRHTTYRKLHLAPPEQGVYTPGTTLPLFAFEGFTIGMLLCYDAHFPLAFQHMAQEGADVIIIPHASPRGTSEEKYDSWMRHLPARAFDNSVWVAAVNQCGTNEAGLSFPPLALALDPSGHLTGPPRLSQGLFFVDISREKLSCVRDHPMRYFLPNTRTDI
ncbi:amidohydrolase [Desulfoluna limicola]|uniref:Amidohydrolase n=1 Tax=Desulfoluna limicola TaxID=2810562 RepID=A0ABN6FE24_9BACT|nr:nitrilase-related carbon-nitrogen hydrolase [Desulfoluna limicola]BCS99215.1 amidohydrolase [Desulfoluna limicola]